MLALGMPANERMDSLVEKATELGVATIQPLVCERSVLRLAGDRAERKAAHWQAVAIAACEQSGRNRVPRLAPPLPLRDWLASMESDSQSERLILSLDAQAQPLLRRLDEASRAPLVFLSGPEGGLSPAEQALAGQHRFRPVTLGPRTLRADTAPLAALASVAALEGR
jgi:16S rRNA (uracil1498-N3)-methyltransferase